MLAKRVIEEDQYDATVKVPFPRSVLTCTFEKNLIIGGKQHGVALIRVNTLSK